MRHTCKKTKKDKQLTNYSRQKIKQLFQKHGCSPFKKHKKSSKEKDFANISNQSSHVNNHVPQKKVQFIESVQKKAQEDPKEYITQYFKRDTHPSVETNDTSNSTHMQPQDHGTVTQSIQESAIQQQQSPEMNHQSRQKMRSVLTIPKIGYAGSTFITDYFETIDMRQSRVVGTQTESAIHELSESTLVYLRKLMTEKKNS